MNRVILMGNLSTDEISEIIVMSNKLAMTSVIVLSVVALGIAIAAYNDDDSIDTSGFATKENVADLQGQVETIASGQQELYSSITDVSSKQEELVNETSNYMTAEDLAKLRAELTMFQQGLTTVSENIIDVPTHESTAPDFNLVLLNSGSIVQNIFTLNDVIYITGDAGVSNSPTISMKIRGPDGDLLKQSEFGIPDSGRFTTMYMVPDLNPGIYTITLSDSAIVDSITFEVQ